MAEPFVINAELKSPAQINARLNVGIPGKDGKDGTSATVSVGTVTIGEPDEASVENVGTESAAVLDFVIPRGPAGPTGPKGADGTNGTNGTNGTDGAPGAAATVTVGTVTTGAPGTEAQVTNSGTENAAILNFTIPRGATGQAGSGTGDMLASIYDPESGERQVAFFDEAIPRFGLMWGSTEYVVTGVTSAAEELLDDLGNMPLTFIGVTNDSNGGLRPDIEINTGELHRYEAYVKNISGELVLADTLNIKIAEPVLITICSVAGLGEIALYHGVFNEGDFSGFQTTNQRVSSISASSTNSQYPTAKAVYDFVENRIAGAIGGSY